MMTIIRTELMLLRRHWGVWSAVVGSLILALSLGDTTPSQLPYWIDESVFRFFLLAPLLLTVSAANRHRASRVDLLLDATPYRPANWVVGRFIANYVLWLLCSIPGWVMAALFVCSRGDSVNVVLLTQHWAATAPVSVFLVTAVGFALGSLPVHELAGYVGAIAYWVVGVALPMTQWPSLLFADLLAPQRYLPLNTVGYFPNGWLVLAHRLFGVGLGTSALALVWLLLSRTRRLSSWAATSILAIALAAVLTGAVGSEAIIARREREYAATEASRLSQLTGDVTSSSIRIGAYDLAATFAPAASSMAVTGSFDVTNAGTANLSGFDLTLRADYVVSRLIGPDGTAIPFQRAGDWLEVRLALAPGESTRLSAQWEGKVWQWGPKRGSGTGRYEGRSVIAHIAPDSIYLPATYGWYPQPGRLALLEARLSEFGSYRAPDRVSGIPPATFALAVSGTDLRVVTNAGGEPAGLYLIGTQLETVVTDGVTITTSLTNRNRATALAAELARRAALLTDTVPPAGSTLQLVEMPQAVADGLCMTTETSQTPGAVLVRTFEYAWGGPLTDVPLLSARWWDGEGANWACGRGLAGFMEYAVTGQQPQAGVFRDGAELFMQAMVALDESQGRQVAIAVLREMYALGPRNLSRGKFVSIVWRYAAGDPRLTEVLSAIGGDSR